MLVIKTLTCGFTCIFRTCRAISRLPSRCCLGWAFWKCATAPAALWAFVIGMVAGFGRLALDLIMRADADAVSKLKVDHYHGLITQGQYDTGVADRATHNGFMFDIWNIHWLYYCEGLFVRHRRADDHHQSDHQAPDPKTVKYTWYGATPEEKAATKASWTTLWT